MTPLDVARRWLARALLTIAVLAALAAERCDPELEPPEYHAYAPYQGGNTR